jgi:hypothetical protein
MPLRRGYHCPFQCLPAISKSVATVVFRFKRKQLAQGMIDDRTVEFEATRPLAPREGLTVVVAWPKGLIAAPTPRQKAFWFVRDNSAAIVLLLGLLLSFSWYYWSWRKVGRDPGKGIIIPLFKPPSGLSPAACRYVLDMSLGSDAFSAAIISLAVKRHIRLRKPAKSSPCTASPVAARRSRPRVKRVCCRPCYHSALLPSP